MQRLFFPACAGQVWDGLNIRVSHEKEVKHILKIINIWSIKEKLPTSSSADAANILATSIFPRKVCEGWITALTNRAHACGIRFSEAAPSSSAVKHSESAPALSNVASKPVIMHAKVSLIKVREITASQPAAAKQQSSKPQPAAAPAGKPEPDDFAAQMHANIVRAMCQFQMQIFQTFLRGATRRLDRWNMKVVMSASYALLHLYVLEYGVVEVHSAALVVACIYLAGKVSAFTGHLSALSCMAALVLRSMTVHPTAVMTSRRFIPVMQAEYLFVKADKLRPIANKFVHTLNEPPLTNNIQVAHCTCMQPIIRVITLTLRCADL
jgi:hypothetical protein